MRRNLIKWEAFERIQKDSLSAAEHELVEASDVLARALGVDHLDLDCYGKSNVVYETLDGTYVRADYDLASDHLTFDNIEELVIDEDTATQAGKKKVADMVEAILGNNLEKAGQIFSDYMSSPIIRKTISEGREGNFVRPKDEVKKSAKTKKKTAGSILIKNQLKKLKSAGSPTAEPRKKRHTGKGPKDNSNYFKDDWKKRKHKPRNVIDPKGKVKVTRFMKECLNISNNVFEFIAFQEYGPVLNESVVKKDNSGNIVAIRIPTTRLRNESRLLTMNYKSQIDNEIKNVREEAHSLCNDQRFCKAVAELKRHNNFSDNEGLQESLNTIIGNWPSVLYLTQEELSTSIAEALNMVGVTNYDDSTCEFMSEGILRTAHETFPDRVSKVMTLARAEIKNEGDAYDNFQDVVKGFYPTLDEGYAKQLKMFSDLFEAVNGVWELANGSGDSAVVQDAEAILEELHAVVNGESRPDLDLASSVAEWLDRYAESNLEGGEWQVDNTPYQTINGEHPAMAEKARKGYAPASDGGSDAEAWHNRATEKQFTGQQWTSAGGEDVFPSLDNPYIPKPFGDYTMKGEKGVDKEKSGPGTWQSGDTWPNLSNPNSPRAETPKSYQMKNGEGTDLVVK